MPVGTGKWMGETVMRTAHTGKQPDCRTCGACCVADHFEMPFVPVDAVDQSRLTHYYRLRVIQDRNGYGSLPVKQDAADNTVCAALRGVVGQRVRCGIYETRPHACRAFVPGSKTCHDVRLMANVDVANVDVANVDVANVDVEAEQCRAS